MANISLPINYIPSNVPSLPTALSITLLLTSLYFFIAAWTPSNPKVKASSSISVQTEVLKPFLPWTSRPAVKLANLLVIVHISVECYGLWVSGQGSAQGPGTDILHSNQFGAICPAESLVYSTRTHGAPRFPLPSNSLLPIFLIIFGGYFRTSAMRYLGKMYTWEVSFLHNEHRLVTDGPYKFVRHPGYTGLLLVCVGYVGYLFVPGTVGRECLWGFGGVSKAPYRILWNLYPLLLTMTFVDNLVYLTRRSWQEDALMKKMYGKEWEEWRVRVRWRILPGVL